MCGFYHRFFTYHFGAGNGEGMDQGLDRQEDIIGGGSATFGEGGLHRYELRRVWNVKLPPLIMILLNPSKATHEVNDPTITRCIERAKRLGCGSLIILNAFAFRATQPEDMMAAADPVGPSNDTIIRCALSECQRKGGFAVVGWGIHGTFRNRDHEICQLAAEFEVPLKCLGVTAGGHPRHPLYVSYDKALEPYAPKAA